MVSVLTSSVVDRVFELRSDQTKDYKIGMCCFSTKHATLRRKSKDWLTWNQDNVFRRVERQVYPLTVVQWSSTIKSNSACWSSTKRTSSSSHRKLTCSRHDIAAKLLNWREAKITHSLTHSLYKYILGLYFSLDLYRILFCTQSIGRIKCKDLNLVRKSK
jgi:hypothetical protein